MVNLEQKILKPYQAKGVEFSIGRNSVPLLMDTGLGKTITSLHCLQKHNSQKILAVVPKTVIDNWAREIQGLQSYTYSIALGNISQRIESLLQDVNISLINFEGVRILGKQIKPILLQGKFDTLIVDELARVRRYSKQTRALRELSGYFRVRIGLSGLLISENLMDVFNPYLILDQGETFGRDFFKFRDKYFEKEEDEHGYFKWNPTEYGKKMIPALVKKTAYIVDSVDIADLPPVSFVYRKISLSKEQQAFLDILEKDWKAVYQINTDEKKEELFNYTIQIIQKSMQCISGFVYKEDGDTHWFEYNPKLQELNAIVEELGNSKFIVWCNYKAEQVAITSLLQKIGKKIHDSTHLVDFDDSSNDCCILSYQRDSQGHNLKSAKTAIFFSRPNSYEKFHQALGRNRRIGSDAKIISYQIIQSKHPLERINDNALRRKKDLANLIKEMKVEDIWKK